MIQGSEAVGDITVALAFFGLCPESQQIKSIICRSHIHWGDKAMRRVVVALEL